jgi:drug/metabolite transporter superfamily protein YnfA
LEESKLLRVEYLYSWRCCGAGIDKITPDRFEIIGASIALLGVFVIM